MKDNIKDKAIYWVTCQKEGLTLQEKEELNLWLESNIEHKKAFDEIKNIHNIFENIPKDYSQTLSNKAHYGAKKIKFVEKTLKPIIACAAVIFALFIGYDNFIPNYEKNYQTQYTNLKKELLPDGSIISIDTKSNIGITYFKNKREVLLQNGQALFEVAKDKNRPFIITSGKTSIEVVGTKFEVTNLDNTTTVSVLEGIVKIGHIQNQFFEPQNITHLKKGEKIILDNTGKIHYLGETEIQEIAPWQNNELIFRKITLKNAFKDFSRYQNIEVEFKTKDIEDTLFSGKFNTKEIDKFLFAIQKIYPIKIKKEQNKIYISKI